MKDSAPSPTPNRLERFCQSNWILGVPWICLVPVLWSGFIADDHFHRMVFAQTVYESNPILSMFGFISQDPTLLPTMMELGITQWWQDPAMQVHFFRPITALTHLLDYTLWPESPLMQHAHNLVWMSATVWAMRRLLKATKMPLSAMVFALLIFAVEDAHVMAAGWIANRSLLLCSCFAMLAAASHIQWRQGKGKRYPSIFYLGIALLCGEAGISAMAFIAAWELRMQQGWSSRIKALVLPLAVVVLWRLAYKNAGFGTDGAGLYTNPTGEPLLFGAYLAERIPIYMAAQWFQFPIDLYAALNGFERLYLTGFCLLLMALAIWRLFPTVKQHQTMQFWALAMVFSIIPICAAMPMERLIFIPGISAAALLGLYLSKLENPWRSPWVLLHLYIGIGFGWMKSGSLPLFGEALEQPAHHLLKHSTPQKDVVFLNANELQAAYAFIYLSLEETPKNPRSITVLAHATQGALISRTDEVTLVIETEYGWFNTPIEGMLRSPKLPPLSGKVFENSRYTASVEKNLPDGRPKRVRFQFVTTLDDERWDWMCAGFVEYESCNPPAIGETIWLPGLLSKRNSPMASKK